VSPIARIARREAFEMWRDGRFIAAAVIATALLVTAFAIEWQRQQTYENERRAAQALDYDTWLKQSDRHPHDAAHQGMHVFKPLPALAAIDPGITPYAGSTIWLQAHRQSEMRFRAVQDATGLQRFGSLSVAWVLQVLAPLIVIVLGFNMFSGEREQGTLKQTLSLGVRLRDVVLGKALALVAALTLLLSPALVALVVAVVSSEQVLDDSLRATGLLGVYSAYFAISVAIVLAVSAFAHTSRASIAWLLALWIVGVTLLPRAATDLARELHASPTRSEFAKALDSELSASHEDAWKREFGTTKRWGTELPLSRWGEALRLDDRVGYEVMDKHFAALWQSFADQQRAQTMIGVFTPILALRTASMSLAGTDFASHRHFAIAAEQHRRTMQDIISEDLVHHADPRGKGHFDYQANHDLWEKIPPFNYAAPSARSAASGAKLSLAVLALNLAIAAITLIAALRYRSRRIL
jgi:ABC-2 type transport system permease protein